MQTTEQVQLIPLSKLHVSKSNTRFPKASDPSIKELAKSLTAEQKTPILVRPYPNKEGHYEIAAGARRYTAALSVEIKALKAIVREYDDATFEETILTENLQREDPDPYAEAILLKKMLERGQNLQEIAAALGKTDTWTMRRAKLAALHKDFLTSWQKGKLKHYTATMMEALAALPKGGQEKVLELMREDSWHSRDLWNAQNRADVEGFLFHRITNSLNVTWLEDPCTFVSNCGPGCAHDSSKQGNLFDTEKKGCGNCLNTSCFIKRNQLFIDSQYAKLCHGTPLPVIAKDSVEIQGQKYERNNDWTLELSKTSKPNSEKVIVFDNGKLSIAYKLNKPSRKSDGKNQASPEEKTENKIAMHQGKRWILVREALSVALEDAPLDQLTTPIDSLIAAFGLPYKESAYPDSPADNKLWDYIQNPTGFPVRKGGYSGYPIKAPQLAPREEALWPSVKQVLLGLMPPPARKSDAVKFETTYRKIASLIGFCINTEKYKADIQIPPPKSWGKVDPHTLEAQ